MIPLTVKITESYFRDTSTVGDTIYIYAELTSFKRGIAKGKVRALKNDEILLNEFEMTDAVKELMVMPK